MAESELVLLRRYATTRDAFAFRELVEQHQDMVFAACHRVLGNRADAEDAAQNCFLKFALAAGRLKAPIGGWLHTVAVRSAIDMLRGETARRARERAVARVAARARTESPWADLRGEVDAAIVALPKRLRTPIVLYFLEGRTQAEIASELGIVHQSVSKRLRRGLESLQRRLKRGGIMTSIVALPTMLSGGTAETAPATLVANLGKMAVASSVAPKAAAVTGGTFATLKTATALVLAAGVGAGAVVIHHTTRPPAPTPLAAAAPVAKKAPRTPEAVLDAELTLTTARIRPSELARLVKEQLGVYVAYHAQVAGSPISVLAPGMHKVRDVLKAIEASAPLTTEVMIDRGRVVICLWQRPKAPAFLIEMMKLAASDVAIERCTAARWLEQVGGRDALVQLLRMLADPDARVRHFAAWSVAKGWAVSRGDAGAYAVPCVAPDGTGLIVAKAIETETWFRTQQNLLYIAGALRDPIVLPALKQQLAKFEEMMRVHKGAAVALHSFPSYAAYQTVARIGGPEAEAFLLAAVAPPEFLDDGRLNNAALYALSTLGTDKVVARLSKLFDINLKMRKARNWIGVSAIPGALVRSRNPAAARELIRIMGLPTFNKRDTRMYMWYLAGFDTPESRAVRLAHFRATPELADQRGLMRIVLDIPAIREKLFAELAQGGVVAHKAALTLILTDDPRLVPPLIEMIGIDRKTLNAGTGHANARFVAFRALGRIGGPEVEKALIAVLKSDVKDKEQHYEALSALAYSSSPEARATLRAALKNPVRYFSRTAAHALTQRPDPADLDLLLAHARTEPPKKDVGPSTAWTAVAAIGGERAARELLADTVKGTSAAACALVFSEDPHCIETVRNALAGDDAKLRGMLLAAFGQRNPPSPTLGAYYAVNAAIAELPGEDEELKLTLMKLLAWTQDPRATDALGKLLVNARESVEVRRDAVRYLFASALVKRRTDDPGAVEPVRHAFEHDAAELVKAMASNILVMWNVIPPEKRIQARPPRRPRPPKPRPPKDPLNPKPPPDEREFPPPPDP